jgi:putative oxidoreductase
MILRRIARPMLAAVFVSGGVQALRDPKPHMQAAQPVLDKTVGQMGERLPDQLPTDAETLVKADAVIKVGAGLALAFNRFPRLASLLLAGSLVPTTAARYRFWEQEDPKVRAEQQTHFMQNVGLLGGLLIASADTHGKPSVNWQARHAAQLASRKARGRARSAAGTVQGTVHQATGKAKALLDR